MILLIDNYDSFTYNLYQAIGSLGYNVKVVTHDEVTVDDVKAFKPDRIVLSPGPKTPKEAGVCVPVIKQLYREIPILGICLGHQCIGEAFGVHVKSATEVMHGHTIDVHHVGGRLFQNISNPFQAARYHSLVIETTPEPLIKTAWDRNGDIMAIEHPEYPLFGVQFHPESFMTTSGKTLLQNFFNV